MPTIQNRRATKSQWSTLNPVLAAGEIGLELGTNKFKIGNGLSAWNLLKYFVDENGDPVSSDFITGAKQRYALPTDELFIPAASFKSSSATVTAPYQDSGPSVSANPWPGYVCVGGVGVGSTKLSTVFKLPQGWGTDTIQMDVTVWWLNMHATEVGSVAWKMNHSVLTPMGALNGSVTLSGPFTSAPAYGQWIVQNTLVYPGIELVADSIVRLDIARMGPSVAQDTLRADALFLGAVVSKSRVGTKGIWERS